jgi:uncharacterized protein (DUF433 family)
MHTISLSDSTFAQLENKALETAQSPDALAEELLRQQLAPQHPYIETVNGFGGAQAMIKGTRVSVKNIVAYTRLGETPETMTQEIMPHLTLAQVYDALSYYHDHQAEIDYDIEHYTTEWAFSYWREKLGEDAYLKITGQAK